MRAIELTKGQVAIVDDEDFEHLAQWRWCFSTGYAARGVRVNGRRQLLLMHRAIMGEKCVGMDVDHINRNPLDNRRCNLRVGTRRQNAFNSPKKPCNTSGFKGVTFNAKGRKFHAQIRINGKNTYLGRFDTPEEAALAYNTVAIRLHGEFANLN